MCRVGRDEKKSGALLRFYEICFRSVFELVYTVVYIVNASFLCTLYLTTLHKRNLVENSLDAGDYYCSSGPMRQPDRKPVLEPVAEGARARKATACSLCFIHCLFNSNIPHVSRRMLCLSRDSARTRSSRCKSLISAR